MISNACLSSFYRCSRFVPKSSAVQYHARPHVLHSSWLQPTFQQQTSNLTLFARNYCRNRLNLYFNNGRRFNITTTLSNISKFRDRFQLISKRTFKEGEKNSIKNEWEEMSKLSITNRLKVMIKKYWYI